MSLGGWGLKWVDRTRSGLVGLGWRGVVTGLEWSGKGDGVEE